MSTPPGNTPLAPPAPPAGPVIPLTPEVRAAYQDLYDSMQKALDSNMDLATIQLLNQWQPQIDLVLTKNDLYRLTQDTAVFAALKKQVCDVNNGLRTLQGQVSSIASHFATAAAILGAINKLLTLIPGL